MMLCATRIASPISLLLDLGSVLIAPLWCSSKGGHEVAIQSSSLSGQLFDFIIVIILILISTRANALIKFFEEAKKDKVL
jgi:hypothetical protein